MNLKERLYLFMEFFRPSPVGGYFDGERLHLQRVAKRPARLYIAVSHKELFFGRLNVSGLNRKHVLKAAELEAIRLLSLMNIENGSPLVTAFSSNSEIIFAFRERPFFEKILSGLPPGLIPCGLFPAALTLLPPNPKDGIYAFFSEDRCEGLIIENQQIRDFLPVDPKVAELVVQEYKGEKVVHHGNIVEYMTASASNIVTLPSNFRLDFPPYKIRIRPQLSLRELLLFILPIMVLGAYLYIRDLTGELEAELNRKNEKISYLKQELDLVNKEIEKYNRRRKALEELSKFKQQKQDVYAILKDLTEIFPKGSWVNKFKLNLKKKELQLSGEADDILTVVKELKKLPWIVEVKLSTVTRNPSTGKERFHLTVKLKESDSSE